MKIALVSLNPKRCNINFNLEVMLSILRKNVVDLFIFSINPLTGLNTRKIAELKMYNDEVQKAVKTLKQLKAKFIFFEQNKIYTNLEKYLQKRFLVINDFSPKKTKSLLIITPKIKGSVHGAKKLQNDLKLLSLLNREVLLVSPGQGASSSEFSPCQVFAHFYNGKPLIYEYAFSRENNIKITTIREENNET